MVLRGQHETRYVYASSALLGPHQLRLRPREDAYQRLKSFDLRISPQPQGQSWGTDADGNACLQAWWIGETHHLLIRTSFEVEVRRENPFDFLMAEGAGALPFRFGEIEQGLAAVYLHDPEAEAVRDYADAVRRESGGTPIELLAHLTRRIYQDIQQEVREQGAPMPPAETLAVGRASCRDLAVLFNAVCRWWGIPARFVSGYDVSSSLQDQGYMHAWSEVYFPDSGWRGFDPSRGLAVAERHVAVAASRDPLGAAPILGKFAGAGAAQMQCSVQLSEDA